MRTPLSTATSRCFFLFYKRFFSLMGKLLSFLFSWKGCCDFVLCQNSYQTFLDIEWKLCKKGVARFCHRMRKTTTNLLNLVLNRIITEPFRFHSFFCASLCCVNCTAGHGESWCSCFWSWIKKFPLFSTITVEFIRLDWIYLTSNFETMVFDSWWCQKFMLTTPTVVFEKRVPNPKNK